MISRKHITLGYHFPDMVKTVLVTGASGGIGRETAELFEDRGWKVYGTSRNPDDTDVAGIPLELDVTDADSVENAVARVIEEQGHIDVLVNNAGVGKYGAVEEVPMDEMQHEFGVNVFGPVRMVQEVLPYMREREEGTIINVSSLAGRLSSPAMGIYAGSKFALEGITDALRVEVSDFGINVVLIEPGPVDTGFGEEAKRPKARYNVTVPFGLMKAGEHAPARVQDFVQKRVFSEADDS
ncbi:MAG: SDR family oxidoreductase [Halobacteria archaeon]|nr:SDR family oxidoreductase [Halobacteria archaeon]